MTGDYYAPPGPGPYPALVAVHGGGWQLGTAEECHSGTVSAHRGYVLFAINYRLVQSDKNRYPAAVHDTRAAVQFLRSQAAALKVDPSRVGCMGNSARARIWPPLWPWRVTAHRSLRRIPRSVCRRAYPSQGRYKIYGVYDLLAQWRHDQLTRPRDHVTEKFLGKSPMESKLLFCKAPPLTYATMTRITPRFWWCGAQTMILWSRVPSRRYLSRRSSKRGFSCGPSLSLAPHFWIQRPLDRPYSAVLWLRGSCASCRRWL